MSSYIKGIVFPCLCFFVCLFYLSAEPARVFYVDAAAPRAGQKGTAERPFISLDQAIEAVHSYAYRLKTKKKQDIETVIIYIRSNLYAEDGLLLTVPVTLKGINNPIISFGDNAGFVVEKTVLTIEGCALKRKERNTEPRTVPIIYGSQSTVVLHGVSVNAEEGGETLIMRNSRFTCADTSFWSQQSAQAVLLRADQSTVSAERCSFSAFGLGALCFLLSDTECRLKEIQCRLMPHYTGRLAEMTRSRFEAEKLECSYSSPLFTDMDAALIADKSSTVRLPEDVQFKGFIQPLIRQ